MSWNEEANIRCLLSYACPQLWSQLDETKSPERRHCKECNRDVFLVHDEEEFAHHAAQGHCVAVPIEGDDSLNPDEEILTGVPTVTQIDIVEY
jgi:hypothetical protein